VNYLWGSASGCGTLIGGEDFNVALAILELQFLLVGANQFRLGEIVVFVGSFKDSKDVLSSGKVLGYDDGIVSVGLNFNVLATGFYSGYASLAGLQDEDSTEQVRVSN